MTDRPSAWAILRELLAVFLIGLGVPTVVVLSVVEGNWWLVGTEALVALGVTLGMRRKPPEQVPEEPRDVQVTVVEVEK